MLKEKICGIYQIRNTLNGNCYIGSSVNITNRWYKHKYQLKYNKHCNPYLQAAWNKYGESNFELKPVEKCKKEELVAKEQYYIDNWKPKYNLQKVADRPPLNHDKASVRKAWSESAKRRVRAGEFGYKPKPVKRICIFTGETKLYESQTVTQQDGFDQRSVSACCNHKKNTYANYYWRFQDDDSPLPEVKRLQFVPVVRIDSNGVIRRYASRQAIVDDGFVYNMVRRICKGTRGRKTYKGYTWQYA